MNGIDNERRRATPEGVTLALRVAGAPVRLLAWTIDALLVMTLQVVFAVLLGLFGELGTGVYLLVLFILAWFYPVFFELTRDGATPGKSVFGLQVVHDDGTPVAASASFLRNLLRFADFLPAAFGAGLVSMLLSPDSQRLGDLAAGTLVVYRDTDSPSRGVASAAPVVPPVSLDLEERRAVVDFAERLPTWSEERARELAAVVRPLTGTWGDEGVARLVGMANWLLGRSEERA